MISIADVVGAIENGPTQQEAQAMLNDGRLKAYEVRIVMVTDPAGEAVGSSLDVDAIDHDAPTPARIREIMGGAIALCRSAIQRAANGEGFQTARGGKFALN